MQLLLFCINFERVLLIYFLCRETFIQWKVIGDYFKIHWTASVEEPWIRWKDYTSVKRRICLFLSVSFRHWLTWRAPYSDKECAFWDFVYATPNIVIMSSWIFFPERTIYILVAVKSPFKMCVPAVVILDCLCLCNTFPSLTSNCFWMTVALVTDN